MQGKDGCGADILLGTEKLPVIHHPKPFGILVELVLAIVGIFVLREYFLKIFFQSLWLDSVVDSFGNYCLFQVEVPCDFFLLHFALSFLVGW